MNKVELQARVKLAKIIQREYDLADPRDEGYRPAAEALAGVIFNECLPPEVLTTLGEADDV